MADPALAVQGAVIDALKGNSAIRALVSDRIFDVPLADGPGATPTFPYVSYGESTTEPERADCLDGSRHTFTLYVWSQARGYREAKTIGSAVIDVLHDADISVPGYILHDLAYESADYRRDDGASYATLTFVALLDVND